jgi:hypothetical protein
VSGAPSLPLAINRVLHGSTTEPLPGAFPPLRERAETRADGLKPPALREK